MSKRYSVKSKLFLMGAVISALSFFMGISNFLGLKKTAESYRHVASVNLTSTELLGSMLAEYRSVRIHLRTLGLEGLSPEEAKKEVEQVHASIAKYEKAAVEYEKVEWAPGEQALYNGVAQAWNAFKSVGARALSLHEKGDPESLKKLKEIFFVECPQSAHLYNEAIEGLIRFQTEQSKTWVQKAHGDSIFANTLSVTLIAIQMIFSMGVAYFIGKGLNRVFTSITEKLTDEADEVTQASGRIQQTSGELSVSASDQANALQKTASAATEVSAMVSKNAENAARSNEITRQSVDQTNRGRRSVQSMITSIGEIDEANSEIMKQVEVSNRQMAEFVEVIHEIGEKTKVINDIVFQTKLLSFNASVEAARAGEHGKGFAVVAEEVGNLAQMSGNAAREISSMLQQSSERVELVANETKQKVEVLIQRAKTKVHQGVGVSRECDSVFGEIVVTVEKISQMMAEIAEGSSEQSQGVEEILTAIHQLDAVTQKNANSSQSAAADAHQLNLEAQKMRDVVNDLTVVVRGSRAA